MFRKTFIRLILVTMVATTTLLVFAATRNTQLNSDTNKECCDNKKECEEPATNRSGYMILETFSRTFLSAQPVR